MKRTSFVITVIVSSITSFGQTVPMGTVAAKQADVKSNTQGFMNQLPMRAPETIGSVYMNEEWQKGDIQLLNENTFLKDVVMNLNLKTNEIEIKHQDQIKLLPGRLVKEFTLSKGDGTVTRYVNGKSYQFNGTPVKGFLQVVDTGKWDLVIKPELKVVKSNYNTALAVGNPDDTITKEDKPYLVNEGVLYETRLSRQKFAKNFAGSEEVVSAYIKDEKINTKKIVDLIKLVQFLNANI